MRISSKTLTHMPVPLGVQVAHKLQTTEQTQCLLSEDFEYEKTDRNQETVNKER